MTASEILTVFVVEDDKKISSLLCDYLKSDGYDPVPFYSTVGVVKAVRSAPPAAIILDIMLEGKNGIEICREIREFSAVPILMLTARIAEDDRILGLEAGADDYVCKPFSSREVMARIAAMVRRADGMVIQGPDLTQQFAIDTHQQRIACEGNWLPLSPAEYVLLCMMLRQRGRVFTRAQLLDALGAASDDSSDRAIDSHIKNIRRKINAVAPELDLISSVYGVGYKTNTAP